MTEFPMGFFRVAVVEKDAGRARGICDRCDHKVKAETEKDALEALQLHRCDPSQKDTPWLRGDDPWVIDLQRDDPAEMSEMVKAANCPDHKGRTRRLEPVQNLVDQIKEAFKFGVKTVVIRPTEKSPTERRLELE